MSINNYDKFINKINSGKTCIGMIVTLTDLTVSELAGEVGYDFTWIDMEHGALSIEATMQHIIALKGTDCAPLVRVPWNEHGVIKPVLDLAPAGVIIPMVNTPEQAAVAVAACRYPPTGNRGCGVRRGNLYGKIPFDDYLKQSETNPMVILQIEHIEAVKNLDAILEVPGIDSFCVGPCDLSGSMGKLNQLDDPEVVKMIDEICQKLRNKGMLFGTAGGPLEVWQQRGVKWIALGSDCGSIAAQAKTILQGENNEENKNSNYNGYTNK